MSNIIVRKVISNIKAIPGEMGRILSHRTRHAADMALEVSFLIFPNWRRGKIHEKLDLNFLSSILFRLGRLIHFTFSSYFSNSYILFGVFTIQFYCLIIHLKKQMLLKLVLFVLVYVTLIKLEIFNYFVGFV